MTERPGDAAPLRKSGNKSGSRPATAKALADRKTPEKIESASETSTAAVPSPPRKSAKNGSRPAPVADPADQDAIEKIESKSDASTIAAGSSQPPSGTRTDIPLQFARTVKAVCHHCGKKYRLSDRYADRLMKCRECGEKLQVSHDVEVVVKPRPPEPPRWRVVLRRINTFLEGGKARAPKRIKWIFNDKRARWVRRAIAATAVLLGVAGSILYWRSDAAAITFSRPEGKEIAVRRIVELEESLAAGLAEVRRASDAKRAARLMDGVMSDQIDLWEAIAGWKKDGFLTDGELSVLMTRYSGRLEAAQGNISAERIRIAGLDATANRTLIETVKRHGRDLGQARSAALQRKGSPFAKKSDDSGAGGKRSSAAELGV